MQSRTSAGWPVFELVSLSVPHDESIGKDLPTLIQVPRSAVGVMYRVSTEVSVTIVDDCGLLSFGTFGAGATKACYDPRWGSVVEVYQDNPAGQPRLVNSSLDKFRESVHAVIERLPYYSTHDGYEQPDAVASELTATLRNIDARAIRSNGFWDTFLGDVRIGDFATEDVAGSG